MFRSEFRGPHTLGEEPPIGDALCDFHLANDSRMDGKIVVLRVSARSRLETL